MSFSSDLKEELSHVQCRRLHCQIAELSAIIAFAGQIKTSSFRNTTLRFQSENLAMIRKCFTLLKKSFNIRADVSVRRNRTNNSTYTLCVQDPAEVLRIMQALKVVGKNNRIQVHAGLVNPLVIQSDCCRRAFVRGSFLAAGSMSDPHKSNHLEIICTSLLKASQMQSILKGFSFSAKTVQRKNTYVVYLKEGDQILDFLKLIEAFQSTLELENIRILHDLANQLNRQTNCDVANSQKTVTAAIRQCEDITLIQRTIGLSQLSDSLAELALLRLEYRDIPLKELGEKLSPPVGKSGVNHRLRKIHEIANKIRENSTFPD